MPTATMTNLYHNAIRDAANGVAGAGAALKITYVAIGTGTTAPAATDTQLVSESFRKPMTSYANGAAAGEGNLTLYLSPADAVGVVIGEVGWFAGSATGAANSGTLVARGLYSHTKTNSESINLLFDPTF